MSETATEAGVRTGGTSTGSLPQAALAGVLAGVVFGVMIQFLLQRMTAIGALYTLGEPSVSIGWIAHMGHSAIFGLLFGVLSWWRPVSDRISSPVGSVVGGGLYGGSLWLVNIVLVWPLWLNAVSAPMSPPFPFLVSVQPLFGHLVWGVLLGGIYWGLRNR
jgi:two-component system OmpR family sensor kinase